MDLNMNDPRMQAAEKRMFKIIAEREMMPRFNARALKPKTIETEFTIKERLYMAYVPVIVSETIWYYVDRVLDYCRENRLSEVKKLDRAVKKLREGYYNFLKRAIDTDHIRRANETAAEFRDNFERHMIVMWITIRNEILKNYPNALYIDMRTDAHCAILMVRVLKQFCRDVDAELERRLNEAADTMNDSLRNLDGVMAGYIGDCEIDRTELIQRCEVILRNAMETITYKE